MFSCLLHSTRPTDSYCTLAAPLSQTARTRTMTFHAATAKRKTEHSGIKESNLHLSRVLLSSFCRAKGRFVSFFICYPFPFGLTRFPRVLWSIGLDKSLFTRVHFSPSFFSLLAPLQFSGIVRS
ncbi:hypothetical protein WN66_01346 [Saccharomyces cerevisiae]|uniref:EC1118_1D0_5545p n=1 Tax=Saccharomyces cerevisiae (strain Lalvin EC1118 / Prise de mousse) TaxID=643680 RepID=C8Z5I7_YEAS8|nr:hypothetical protein FOB22_001157 [Saccharomyces cerevisiae]KAF4006462.1 hypothetical protein FOB22_000075 [Saccharomyces cerevisiae]KZV12513.1 hypothetical protein WN66_01346 [Saccharomyces cerevisiae]CAY78776.1 EC1118_1D0_5545p [Saccharomyces cerevisiae EC1118]